MGFDFDPTSMLFYARVERERKKREKKDEKKKKITKRENDIPGSGRRG
jgi:hypothetical protein